MATGKNLFLMVATAAAIFVAAEVAEAAVSDPKFAGGDEGNWQVGDCILAQFAMEIVVYPNPSDPNVTETLYIPTAATADQDAKNCDNSTQILALRWTETPKNDTSVTLQRNVTLMFVKNETQSSYGMSGFFASMEYAKWTDKDENGTETTHTSTIVIDSHLYKIPMFQTPLDRSFLCNDVGQMQLLSYIKYEDSPPAGIDLHNSTVEATKLQIDIFRARDHAPAGFRTPMDCDFHPDDAVPIAVGVALAGMVLAVLAAYMYGRRRNQQRGYESV